MTRIEEALRKDLSIKHNFAKYRQTQNGINGTGWSEGHRSKSGLSNVKTAPLLPYMWVDRDEARGLGLASLRVWIRLCRNTRGSELA